MYLVLQCIKYYQEMIIMDREMMKGSIDLLLLSLIEHKDLYGYEMIKILKDLSDDSYEMSDGTLYPALKRLERKGWVESYWKESEIGRRKYYTLKEEGKKELERKRKNWRMINELVKKSSEGFV